MFEEYEITLEGLRGILYHPTRNRLGVCTNRHDVYEGLYLVMRCTVTTDEDFGEMRTHPMVVGTCGSSAEAQELAYDLAFDEWLDNHCCDWEVWHVVAEPEIRGALEVSYTAYHDFYERIRLNAIRSFCRIDNPRTFQTALDDCREGVIEVPITFITPKHDKDNHASKHVIVRW